MVVPTNHPPGSAGKIEVLTERAADHRPLWHSKDAGFIMDVVGLPSQFEPVSGNTEDALNENYKRFVEAVCLRQKQIEGEPKSCGSWLPVLIEDCEF